MKSFVFVLTLILVMFIHQQSHAAITNLPGDSIPAHDSLRDSLRTREYDQPIPEETFRKKKIITSILAFPVPFGFIGLHRIYLGTEPWVPIVYLLTGGGGAGLLPLIDFIFIVTANEEEFKQYENNPNLFMWME